MQVRPRQDLNSRADQMQGLRRHLSPEIEHAGRQVDFVEIRKQPRISACFREIHDGNSRYAEQPEHQLARGRVAIEQRGIHVPRNQLLRSVHAIERHQLGVAAGGDAVGLEQVEREPARAAAFAANRDSLALELRQLRHALAAIKNHDGDVKDTAERHER